MVVTYNTGAYYFNFYEPLSNPSTLSGKVGGPISDITLKPVLGQLFVDTATSDIGDINQFRKVYVRQDVAGEFVDLEIGITNVEHSSQIKFFISEDDNDYTPNGATDYPTGTYGTSDTDYFTGDSSTLIEVGNSSVGDTFGVWIRQTIEENSKDDSLASFSLQIIGTKIN